MSLALAQGHWASESSTDDSSDVDVSDAEGPTAKLVRVPVHSRRFGSSSQGVERLCSSGSLSIMKRAFEDHITVGGKRPNRGEFVGTRPPLAERAISEAMIDAAKLVQKVWRGFKTKMLYWRYLNLMRIRGFTQANPSVADFIANTPLNVRGGLR